MRMKIILFREAPVTTSPTTRFARALAALMASVFASCGDPRHTGRGAHPGPHPEVYGLEVVVWQHPGVPWIVPVPELPGPAGSRVTPRDEGLAPRSSDDRTLHHPPDGATVTHSATPTTHDPQDLRRRGRHSAWQPEGADPRCCALARCGRGAVVGDGLRRLRHALERAAAALWRVGQGSGPDAQRPHGAREERRVPAVSHRAGPSDGAGALHGDRPAELPFALARMAESL